MPLINLGNDFENVKEPQAVPEGEYRLRVVDFQDDATSKAGNPMLVATVAIEDPDHPEAATIREYMPLPTDDDDPQRSLSKMRRIKRFLRLFDIPYEGGGFDSEDVIGAEADALLLQETVETQDGEEMVVNRIRYPRLD